MFGDNFFFITIAGAIGGFISCLYGYVVKRPVADHPWIAFPSSILLGMLAGGVMTFAFPGATPIAAPATAATLHKTFYLAMLWGFSWKIVLEAISAYASKTAQNLLAARAQETAEKGVESANKLSATAQAADLSSSVVLTQQIKDTKDTAIRTVQALHKVEDKTIAQEVRNAAVTAVNGLESMATNSTDPAVMRQATSALSDLGKTAVANEVYSVANATISALNRVRDDAGTSKEVKEEVSTTLEGLRTIAVPPGA